MKGRNKRGITQVTVLCGQMLGLSEALLYAGSPPTVCRSHSHLTHPPSEPHFTRDPFFCSYRINSKEVFKRHLATTHLVLVCQMPPPLTKIQKVQIQKQLLKSCGKN